MAAKKKQKVRAQFRKNRAERARSDEWTRKFRSEGAEGSDDSIQAERISGKGELNRRRTVLVEATEAADGTTQLEVDAAVVKLGRVLAVQGLLSTVQSTVDGSIVMCATRRLLKTMATDERHVVAAGDFVMFRPVSPEEGIIERVEPRRSVLSRATRGRQHILVANADQLLIVGSAAEPYLKPNLLDRFLISAHQTGLRPLICINKVDLIDPASLAPLVGTYSQMGYRVLLLSATTGFGIDRLRHELAGRSSVIAGQSGVGKSSLLNAVDSNLVLRTGAVSSETQKGKHTTTTARLWPLSSGGYVIDTPGIRQFQLWDVIPAEVAAYFRDLRPYINHCRFPNCTHTHESNCAVKNAVADGWLDLRRYESYCQLFAGEAE
jgi:ribosome biogenesis GTPase / thiamine phosphate phosphatase